MFAVGLTSLGSRFVSPGLCDQVQRVASTGQGREDLSARQVSRFLVIWNKNVIPLNLHIFSFLVLGSHRVCRRGSDDRRVPGRRCPR